MTNPSDTLITPLISSVLAVSKLPEKARVVQTTAVAYISKASILIFRLSSKIDSTPHDSFYLEVVNNSLIIGL